MSAIVNVVLPVFAIILAGFLAGRRRLLGAASSEALNAFVYWIALPPLLFLAMARAEIAEILYWPFIGAFLGSLAAVWIIASLIGFAVYRPSPAVVAMQGLNASFSNTGYMGIPLLAAAFGEAGIAPATLATVLMSAVSISVAIISLEIAGAGRQGLAATLGDVGRALSRNPLLLSPLAGVAWSMADLPLPVPAVNLFQLVGASAGPCALFAIGLFMASRPLAADLAEVTWISILKLLWQPLICYGLAVTVFPMDPFWTACAVILAALPTGALTFVLAQGYGVYVERTSATILVSTVLSIVPLSILLAVYGPRFAAQ